MMKSFRSPQSPMNFKFFELLNEKKLVDVTLVAEGQFIQGHKLVLAATSTFFDEIFNILPGQQPAIVLKDVSYEQVQQMMQFIYCGSVDIMSEEVAAFEKVLESLKIKFVQPTEESDEESYVDDKEFEDMIDVDRPEWAEVQIKTEPDDEAGSIVKDYSVIKEQQEQEKDDDSDGSFAEVAQDPSSEHKYAQCQPRMIRRVIRPSFITARPLDDIFRRNQNSISLDRVVPSKKIQGLMFAHPEFCPFCEKHCKTNKHRNEHVKYCFSNPHRVVSMCPLCHKSVCDPYYLRKHMRNVHGKNQR